MLPKTIRKAAVFSWGAAFLVCLLVILFSMHSNYYITGDKDEFEVGKVADRDVIIEQAIRYEDKEATRLRIEAQEQLVAAVFNYSFSVSDELRMRWNNFQELVNRVITDEPSGDVFKLALHSEYPAYFPDSILDLLYHSQDIGATLLDCTAILNTVLERGVFSMPRTGLEGYNPDMVELIRQTGTRIETERIPKQSIILRSNVTEAVAISVVAGSYPLTIMRLAPELLQPFLRENVFYSPEETVKRIAEIGYCCNRI